MIVGEYKNTIFRLGIKINDLTSNHNHIRRKRKTPNKTPTRVSSPARRGSVLQAGRFGRSHEIRVKVQLLVWLQLAGFLQEFVLLQSEGHAHRHLGDEALAGRLGHLLTESQVDLADAAAALEEAEGMVCDTVAHWREAERKGGVNTEASFSGPAQQTHTTKRAQASCCGAARLLASKPHASGGFSGP